MSQSLTRDEPGSDSEWSDSDTDMPCNQDQDGDQNGSESDDENIMFPQIDLQQRRMTIGKQMS